MHLCFRRLYKNYSSLTKYTATVMKKSSKISPVTPKLKPILDSRSKLCSKPENTTFQVLASPVKSDSDKKIYKVIRLANGLTACLISDTSPILENEIEGESDIEDSSSGSGSETGESGTEGSDEDSSASLKDIDNEDSPKRQKSAPEQKLAAAGLCIGVGSFSDPKQVPGMAHFLEHMVFMGSEKYPKENSFDEFIKRNGGSDNASTDAETTVFYFECLEKHLAEALDRFSQFFIAPLMKREAMTREREAIESEFQISVNSDGSRKEQLICCLAKKDSPVNSFPWGNLKTLRDDIKDDDLYKGVHDFRERHYSAHRMTLAIQARLPMEELEEYALKSFCAVPNNDLPPDNYSQLYKNIFDTPDFNKLYYIKPVKDSCQIDLTWALPSLKDKYKSKPHHFLSYLLGDEGKGSLLSYLKKKLWVLGTSIGNSESGIEHNSLYTFFTVNLNLTDEGFDHINDVVESIFSYLLMLKQSGPQQRIFDELQSIFNMTFKYAREEGAVDLVESMCEAMQFYPPEDYITGPELYFEYDPKAIDMIIDMLTPDKANIMILKQTPGKEIEFDMTEKWFGTQYTTREIPEPWMKQWKNPRLISELYVCPPNSFITNDFTILPDIVNNPEYPQKILDNSLVELWYRKDQKFKLPMAYYYFYLISPLSVCDVKHLCMLDTLVNLLTIHIAEEIYPAGAANLSHTFMYFEKGLIIKVWGFNEKLPILLNLIVKNLLNLSNDINENMFHAIKDKLLKNYFNKLLNPGGLAKDIRLTLLADGNWHPADRYSAMLDVSYDDIKKYSKDFLETFYVKALVQGNVTQETATKTVNEFVKNLNYKELKKEKQPVYHIVRVNKGEQCCRIQSFNKKDTNSFITNYYQSDYFTVQNCVIVELVLMVIEEPLFDILRTQEQLGYHVSCSVRDTFGVLGYTITVNAQATKNTTQYVNERIEVFLKHTQKLFAQLGEEDFNKIKTNLIKMKQCSDVDLKEEVDRSWSEITSGDYIFDRIKREIEVIGQTNLDKIRLWWDRHNSFGNKENFRKLSIQVVGFKDVIKEDPKGPSKDQKLEVVYLGDSDDAISEKRHKKYFIKSIKEYKKSVEIFNYK